MNSMLINVWVASIVVLLLCSNVIPTAFSGAIIIFYCPFVIFGLYMISYIPRDMWLVFGLMCLFLYNM